LWKELGKDLKSNNSTVLIIGYQRPKAIRQILEICKTAQVSKIYLSIDAPKLTSSTSSANLMEIKSVIAEHATFFDKIFERFLPENVGCAANLLSACDWVFANEDFVIIFEDDCIPSLDFFKFTDSVKDAFDKDPRSILICGTQFVPVDNQVSNAIKSKYSLTWGWATTRDKWNEIRRAIRYAERETRLNILSLNHEKIYWQEGSRRAALGYVDVWDTILVKYLVENNLYAILPQENLIQNIGNDSVAVHVEPQSQWTQTPVGHFTPNKIGAVEVSEKAERWLRDNFYIMRRRHLISTRITRFCDKMKGPNLKSLNSRWDRASEF
jgi:hypothetical protein